MANELKRVGLVFKEEGAVDFRKTLQEINLELNSNYNQFKLTQAQWDKSTKTTEKLTEQQRYLTNAIEIQQDKVSTLKMQLSDLENAENKNATAIKKKRNELTNAEIKLKNYEKQLEKVNDKLTNSGKKIEEWGKKVEKSGEKIEKAGKKLSVFSGATATAMVACAKSAIDFESAFTGVEKTVDGTEEQMEELKQGIRDMAKELPSSTTEISAIAEAAGQLGIKTENILDFSKAMIDLGNSTNLSADQAASQLAKFANIMGMSQKDFDRLGSSIVDLGNHFATTEADIVEMAMRLAGAGKQVGLSEGEVLGLATALSSVGIEAEMGGSAISKAMVKMQNAVELGGGKLNDVLKKSGKSLRDLELMSANNSKAFKEFADGLGMTSTELKNMITAGANLEDFAKVSGMSVEQFKKAWKEDAVGALNEFIKGLGNAEDKGESAITMLSEMGLTEVRLRDSLLRAANAGDLLSDAIKTGNDAWEDNTALTNEANKRYDTLKSKITTALNKLKDMAITIGNKLMPHIEKIVDGLSKWIDKFDDLSDSQVETIINIGLMVTALGPLIATSGKLISTIGGAAKGIGTFTQAIKVMKTGTDSGKESIDSLAGILKGITSPVGLAVIGITALVTAFQMATQETRNYAQDTKLMLEDTKKAKQTIDELKTSIDNKAQAELYEIDRSKELWEELQKITDENGKIKEGYEDRVKVITKELSGALGKEITITGNIINNYKDLRKEIDKLILKKKAEIILNANEEKYQEAIKNRTQKTQELLDKQEELNEAKKKEAEYQEEYQKAINLGTGSFNLAVKYQDWQNQAKAVKNLSDEVSTLTHVVDGYTQDMQDYQYNFELYSKGTESSLKEMSDSVTRTYTKNGETVKASFVEQIKEQEIYLTKAKELNDKAVKENNNAETKKTQTTIDESNKRLDKIIEELTNQTSLVQNNEDVENAWKDLATNSYEKYSKALSKMPPETQKKIQEITGVIANDKNVEKEMKELAKDVDKGFNNNIDPEKWGKDMVDLLTKGAKDVNAVNGLKGAAIGLADTVRKILHFSVPDEGPLSDADEYMPDMIDLMAKGIDKNKSKLTNSVRKMAQEAKDEMQLNEESDLLGQKASKTYSSKNANYNLKMNVYCQKLDESELENIFNYVNRRFGTQY